MRITIVTAYFAPEISPITHLYRDLAEELTALGAQVTVVTNYPVRGLTAAESEAYQNRRDERTPEGYRILRVGKPGSEGVGLIKRGLRLLSGTAALYRAAKAVPTDAYLLGSMPPFLGPVGALLQKRARTVYILQDIFPDTLLLMGRHGEGHPFVRLGRWMERISYRGNTRFITLSADMANTLQSRGVPKEKLTVIGNWADTAAIRPVSRGENPLFEQLGLDPKGFYAVYAGTLGPLQCPDLLLDSMALLRNRPEITFLLFGGGALTDHVRQRIAAEGLTNVKLFPLLPADRAAEVYSLGDVALIPLNAGTLRFAMPSKTWTAMAAGRPLILTGEPDSVWAQTVESAGCGWTCPPGDAKALAACIENAYGHRQTLPDLSKNARSYAEKALSRRDAAKRYFEVLSKE